MSNSCFNVLQATANIELFKIDHWLRANKLYRNNNKTDAAFNTVVAVLDSSNAVYLFLRFHLFFYSFCVVTLS